MAENDKVGGIVESHGEWAQEIEQISCGEKALSILLQVSMGGMSEKAYISDLRRALGADDRINLLSANGGY